jgi:hypothetical protein
MLNTAFPWCLCCSWVSFVGVGEVHFAHVLDPLSAEIHQGSLARDPSSGVHLGIRPFQLSQQPFYIRGLEVGLAGVLIGLVMLRFGILATLVWHYCVDALYTAVLLFRSGNLYFILTAAVGCGLLLAPLIIAVIVYRRKGGFEPEEGLSNAQEGLHRMARDGGQIAEPMPASDYRRLPLQRIAWDC